MARLIYLCVAIHALLSPSLEVAAAKTCSPPTGFGYQINVAPGPNKNGQYTHGKVVTFSCPPHGYTTHPDPPPKATCQSDGSWNVNFTATPVYCQLVSCSPIDDNYLIPFGKIKQTSAGGADPKYTPADRQHIFGAVVTYTCDPGATVSGNGTSVCQEDGTWSGNAPYCTVPPQTCKSCASSKTGLTQCCSMQTDDLGCCSKAAQQTISARFDGLPKSCAADLEKELLPCGGRLLKCFDSPTTLQNTEDCQKPLPKFGCYHNRVLPVSLGKDLDGNCSALATSSDPVSCVLTTTESLGGTQYPQGLCLPSSCAGDQATIDKIVASTLEMDCKHDMLVDKLGFCVASSLSLTCSNNKKSTMTPSYPGLCQKDKCPKAPYPTWTECCAFNSTESGCCSSVAKDVLNSRFAPLDASPKCSRALHGQLSSCMSQLTQCLSNTTGTNTSNCPNLHGCTVPIQTEQTCTQYAGANSVYCTKTCAGAANCNKESFCLPADCASKDAITQIATGDAQISCGLLKSGSGIQFCNEITVKITCSGGLTGAYSLVDVPKACQKPPNADENGYFSVFYPSPSTPKGTYPSGTVVEYFCNAGFKSSPGAFNITCNNGNWNGSAPACTAVDCGKPTLDTKTAAKVSYTGKTTFSNKVMFTCPQGYNAFPTSSSCQANGTWDYHVLPYCISVKCPPFEDNKLIPFGSIKFNVKGKDPRFTGDDLYSIFGAQVKYTCDKGAAVTGTAVRTCGSDRSWSGDPYCEVPISNCTTESCAKSADSETSCCALDSQTIGCCSEAAMVTLGSRFDGLKGQCAMDIETELLPCGGRLIQCLDFPGKQKNELNCNPTPTFGCYKNQILPSALGDKLDSNCQAYSETQGTISCLAETTVTLTGTLFPQGFCLPKSCNQQAMLDKVASSTIDLDCNNDLLVANGGFCQASGIKITCENNLTSSYTPPYPAQCSKGKCPVSKTSYPKWTECCSMDGKEIGCCSPLAQQILSDRFSSFSKSPKCSTALAKQLSPCLSQLTQCLSNVTAVGEEKVCPDLHGCSAPFQTNDTCEKFAGKGSLFCTRSCPGQPNCDQTSFCVPKDCTTADALSAMAYSDAVISCNLWKTGGVEYCRWVNVTITCEDGTSGAGSYDDRAKFCKPPIVPSHGNITVTRPPGANKNYTYPVGASVTYACDHGYGPDGNSPIIHCQDDGTWDFKGSNCNPVDCKKPMVDPSSGVVIDGKSYTFGDVVHFKCSEEGFYATPASSVCQADTTWDYDTLPYCQAANCPDLWSLYGENNENKVPYGTVMLERTGVNDSAQIGQSDHLYGAKLKYICSPPALASGPTTLTCQNNSQWSSPPPICDVPLVGCNSTTDCKDVSGHPTFTECCSYGTESLGLSCCPTTTKSVLSARFDGLAGQCLADMTAAYSSCSNQVVQCLSEPDGLCGLEVQRFYTYGCNGGVPVPPATQFTDELNKFCHTYGPANSVACLETVTLITGEQVVGQTACIPDSCVNDTSLAAIAKSSLEMYCAINADPFYCQYQSVQLDCQTGISAQIDMEASCSQCPPPDQPTLTECCEVQNYTLGCCSKGVHKVVEDRFVNASQACQEGLGQQLSMCGQAIVSCMNQVELKGVRHACPNWHNCHDWIGMDACQMNLDNVTTECMSTCSGVDTCHAGHYCLPQACMNEADVQAVASQDALLNCGYYKFASGNTTCGQVSVNTQCYASDGNNISAAHNVTDNGVVNITMCNKPFIPDNGYVLPAMDTYRSGVSLHYYCDKYYRYNPQGTHTTYSVNITCMPFGGWQGYPPDCVPVNCPDILGNLDGGRFPYGQITVQQEGVNGSECTPGQEGDPCLHTATATLKYNCDNGTKLVGSLYRTCTEDGTWNGTQAICTIPTQPCSVKQKTCSGSTPVCISVGTDSGPMCGTRRTQEFVDVRFAGLSGDCKNALLESFAPCMTQVIDCLNRAESSPECLDFLYNFYMYGCNNGAPPPRPEQPGKKLHQFCEAYGPPSSLACVDHSDNIDASSNDPIPFCLPSQCTGDLQAFANATRMLRCKALDVFPTCQVNKVDLTCEYPNATKRLYGSAAPDTSCDQCPHPGQDASLTECCALGDVKFGCCRKNVSDILAMRFAELSTGCTQALGHDFRPCRAALLDCYNQGKNYHSSPDPLNNCPSLYGCTAKLTRGEGDCIGFTGANSSYCAANCTTDIGNTKTRDFCLPGMCTNEGDIQAYAQSEASVVCYMAKQATKQLSCGEADSLLSCDALGFSHEYSYKAKFSDVVGTTAFAPTTGPLKKKKSKTGVIVGGIMGSVLAVGLTVLVYLFYRRRYARKRGDFTPLKNLQEDEDEDEEA
eukprot:scpid3832/ scgid17115/ CUB and sushi domain-containing protein 3; CUB and sushi multiple domains protein 3